MQRFRCGFARVVRIHGTCLPFAFRLGVATVRPVSSSCAACVGNNNGKRVKEGTSRRAHDSDRDTEAGDRERARRETFLGTVPNQLSTLRLVSAPLLGGLIACDYYNGAFLCGGGMKMAVFAASGALDWLDGFIARQWEGQRSVFGSLLDPVADKALVGCAAVALTYTGWIPVWLTTIVMGRDVALVLFGFYFRFRTREPGTPFFSTMHGSSFEVEPSLLSKLNTAAQLSLITGALAAAAFQWPSVEMLQYGSFLVAATTIGSAYGYLRNPAFRMLTKSGKPPV